MADNREISKKEKQIIKDIMSRSNYGEEKASKIAKEMVDFGYTIHEQDYFKLKNIIKVLDREFGFETTDVTDVVYIECQYSKAKFTKEEDELLKEVLSNER